MSILEAIILGIVQGLSEFLPISSTAHVTLAGRAFGLIDPAAPERWTAFLAVIQLGTLAAVLAYFRKDLVVITRQFLRDNLSRTPFRNQSTAARTGWYIIISTIPIAVIGLLAKDFIEGSFTKNLMVIGTSLMALGLVLEIAERVSSFNRPLEKITLKDSILIGFAQVFALIPGASRSGTTITGGLFLGLTREAAARFSFLMSIPAIGASGLLQFVDALEYLDTSGMTTLIIATIASGISGYLTIALLLRYLRTRTTRVFVLYRILLGGGILLAIYLGYLSP